MLKVHCRWLIWFFFLKGYEPACQPQLWTWLQRICLEPPSVPFYTCRSSSQQSALCHLLFLHSAGVVECSRNLFNYIVDACQQGQSLVTGIPGCSAPSLPRLSCHLAPSSDSAFHAIQLPATTCTSSIHHSSSRTGNWNSVFFLVTKKAIYSVRVCCCCWNISNWLIAARVSWKTLSLTHAYALAMFFLELTKKIVDCYVAIKMSRYNVLASQESSLSREVHYAIVK